MSWDRVENDEVAADEYRRKADRFVQDMREEHGRGCEFLTVAEVAPDHFGFDLPAEELERLHDRIVRD